MNEPKQMDLQSEGRFLQISIAVLAVLAAVGTAGMLLSDFVLARVACALVVGLAVMNILAIGVEHVPDGRAKSILAILVGVPLGLIRLVFRLVNAIGGVWVAIIFLLFLAAVPLVVLVWLTDAEAISPRVGYYVGALVVLLGVAYGPNTIILPVAELFSRDKLFTNPKHYEEHVRDVATALRIADLRRRAYEIGIVAYIAATLEELAGTPLINYRVWLGTRDVLLGVLITFLAIDAYLSLFRPKLLKRLTTVGEPPLRKAPSAGEAHSE